MGKRQRFDDEGNAVVVEDQIINDMHPRNKYKLQPPNFDQLAQQYDTFRPFVTYSEGQQPTIDFKDPAAVRALTYCLLKHDFQLDVTFPLDRLCPPVPNRLNYLLWIEDLLNETDTSDSHRDIIGLDIGVGASCIYPLLGCRMNPHWRFHGTELDPVSFKYANDNVERNKLQGHITLELNNDSQRIFISDNKYDFCMCNPPFYASEEELQEGLEAKELEPFAVCTGTSSEMITQGGEIGFVERMILESLQLKEKIHWYTSMIGLKRSIRPITSILKKHGITNYVVTEFCQGRTKRWGIAWSFSSTRIVKSNSLEHYRPKSRFDIYLPLSISKATSELHTILTDLDITLPTATASSSAIYKKGDDDGDDDAVTDNRYTIQLALKYNSWSRAARRAKKRQKVDKTTVMKLESLDVTVECTLQSKAPNECEFIVSWLQGENRSGFESFWNHVKKRMEQSSGIFSGSVFQE